MGYGSTSLCSFDGGVGNFFRCDRNGGVFANGIAGACNGTAYDNVAVHGIIMPKCELE
jgi:hypothetical protein